MGQLTDADRALLQQAQTRARARMTGRTIDETGRDISERRPEPELIQPGWYWTGRHVVWVVGPCNRGQWIHCQTAKGDRWVATKRTVSWQRVHEQVKASGQGFGWKPRDKAYDYAMQDEQQ